VIGCPEFSTNILQTIFTESLIEGCKVVTSEMLIDKSRRKVDKKIR